MIDDCEGRTMRKSLFTLLMCSSLYAQACSFAPGFERFTPSIATFQEKLDGDRIAHLPAPSVSGVHVTRGTASPGATCDDAGILTLELSWPKSSVYKLNEVGFYFRVLSGDQPDQIFPLAPVSGQIVGRRARFTFVWLDGNSSARPPLNLEVEVFAVNRGLEIGAPRRFKITDEMH